MDISSTKLTPSTESSAITPPIARDNTIGSTRIRPFKGLRIGREDLTECIKDLGWLYDQYQKANGTGPDKTLRLLFRQNLEAEAYDWYIDLRIETKNDRDQLQSFLKAFEVIEKDAQAKKFELRSRMAQL
jgi:hypothetical protein